MNKIAFLVDASVTTRIVVDLDQLPEQTGSFSEDNLDMEAIAMMALPKLIENLKFNGVENIEVIQDIEFPYDPEFDDEKEST